MRNLVLGIIFFSIMINLATGIMMTAIPGFEGMDARIGLGDDNVTTIDYVNNSYMDAFSNPINSNPTGEDAANVNSDTLMDRTVLGGILNIKAVFDKFIFGFVNVLKSIFGAWVPELVFNGMKMILGLLYFIIIFELISGRKILGD